MNLLQRRISSFRLVRQLGGDLWSAWRAALTGRSGKFRSRFSGILHRSP